MIDFIQISDWQTHHLLLFNVGGVRFDLHFVIWFLAGLFFIRWCDNSAEKRVASVLLVFQLVILTGAALLDYVDYMNSTAETYSSFIAGMSQEQERSFGIRPDAFLFALFDYLTILVLVKMVVKPYRVIDPIVLVLCALILLHLVVATFNFDTAGAMMAYDLIWIVLYYVVFALMFLTSSKMGKRIGHIRVFDYCSLFSGKHSQKTIFE